MTGSWDRTAFTFSSTAATATRGASVVTAGGAGSVNTYEEKSAGMEGGGINGNSFVFPFFFFFPWGWWGGKQTLLCKLTLSR